MIKKNKGYILLLVMTITSMLSLLVFCYWQKMGLILDLVTQKEKYYKNFYLNQALLNYSLFLIKNNFENYYLKIYKTKQPVNINLDSIVENLAKNSQDNYLQNLRSYTIVANVIKEKKQQRVQNSQSYNNQAIIISTFLQDKNNKILFKLSCLLIKDVQKNEFIVKNNTIGNFF
ncbi:MAG: hypothetical protein WC436_02170 [Candidatus Babeliales bacterium]